MASVIERTLKGGIGLIGAGFASKSLTILFVLIASRALGATEFGLFALALSLIQITEQIGRLGLPATVQKYLAGTDPKRAKEVLAAILLMGIGSGLAISLLVYLFTPNISWYILGHGELVPPLRTLTIGLVLGILCGLLRALLQSQEKFTSILFADVSRDSSKVLFLLLFVLLLPDSSLAPAWSFISGLVAYTVVLMAITRRTSIRPGFPLSLRILRSVGGFAAPLAFVGFGYAVAQRLDCIMLGALSTTSAVGIYSAISTLALATGFMHQALVPVFFPIASSAHRHGTSSDLRTAYFVTASWASLPAAILLLTFLGFGRLLLTVFGPEYSTGEAYYILLILSSMAFMSGWVGPSGALLQMSGGQRLEFYNTIVFLGVNLGLNLLLIPPFGAIGASVATLTSGLVRNTMQVIELALINGFVPIGEGQLKVLIPLAIAFGLAIILGKEHLAIPLVAVSASCALVLLFVSNLSALERDWVRKFAARLSTLGCLR